MKTIWKFRLLPIDITTLSLPIGAEILTIQLQHGKPFMWIKVDPDRCLQVREFKAYGTGHPMPNADKELYIETYQDGVFVWHIFEIIAGGE